MKKCIPLELLKKFKYRIRRLFENETINYKDYDYYVDYDLLENSTNVEIILKAEKIEGNKTKISCKGYIKGNMCFNSHITIRQVKNKYELTTNFNEDYIEYFIKENVSNLFYMQFELVDDLELSFEWGEEHYARPRAER